MQSRSFCQVVPSPTGHQYYGSGPEQHGITSNAWNRDNPDLTRGYQTSNLIFPTIFFNWLPDQRDSSEIGRFIIGRVWKVVSRRMPLIMTLTQ